MDVLTKGAKNDTNVQVLPRAEPLHPFAFSIEAAGSDDRLEVLLEDVYSELSETFQLRLATWVQRQTARLMEELSEKIRQTLG